MSDICIIKTKNRFWDYQLQNFRLKNAENEKKIFTWRALGVAYELKFGIHVCIVLINLLAKIFHIKFNFVLLSIDI